MKAWVVRKKYEFCATVVFARTSGKAKSLALGSEPLENADFCSIEAKRAPEMDKYYKEGKTYMEWCDPEDRVAMVKDANFTCEYIEMSECETCQAREFCGNWEESEE